MPDSHSKPNKSEWLGQRPRCWYVFYSEQEPLYTARIGKQVYWAVTCKYEPASNHLEEERNPVTQPQPQSFYQLVWGGNWKFAFLKVPRWYWCCWNHTLGTTDVGKKHSFGVGRYEFKSQLCHHLEQWSPTGGPWTSGGSWGPKGGNHCCLRKPLEQWSLNGGPRGPKGWQPLIYR